VTAPPRGIQRDVRSSGTFARGLVASAAAVLVLGACTPGGEEPAVASPTLPPSPSPSAPVLPSAESELACTIVGTDDNDVLRGTDGADVICGLHGDDAIVGLGGDDAIFGGRGNDRIDGGPGEDHVSGDRGADLVTGGDGVDDVEGGPSRDAVSGDAGSDVVQAGRGHDFCVSTGDGVEANDVANGGPGFDRYDADPGDLLDGVETSAACSGALEEVLPSPSPGSA
jgi:Ca2+-binding RTX toxin-like protein